MTMKISYRGVDELIPYERNSRTHSDEQIAQVANSITEFGFTNPLLIGEDNVVIAGHGRLMAAKKLGMLEVPTIELSHLTPEQRRAYVIADNKLAEQSGWDADLLALELGDLASSEYDLSLLGFDDKELLALLAAMPGLTDPDDVPDLGPEMITQAGDNWIMGKHRLRCGDSTCEKEMKVLCSNNLVDMWITDPPYNVAYEGKTKDALTIKNDSMNDESFRAFLTDAYKAADGSMKSGAVFYIWHADSEGYNFRGAAKDVGWDIRQCLIWKKNSMVMGRQDYHWQHEPCLYGWKSGSGHLWSSDRKQTTILEFDRPTKSKEHPTMKPVALMEYQILNNSKGDDIILDSFGGSGSTLIAAEKNGRICYLMELDARYCDVIIRRWQEFTGHEAVLESSQKTFKEVCDMRAVKAA